MPTDQIIKVRHTSAKERLKGFIRFDIVTAIGTEIEIEIIKHAQNIHTKVFYCT
jgi:hypothetical protein